MRAGLVFVAAAPTSPVLVRVNFDDARFNGVEFNSRGALHRSIERNRQLHLHSRSQFAQRIAAERRRRHSAGDGFCEFALSTSLAFLRRRLFDAGRTAESSVVTRSGRSQNRRGAFASATFKTSSAAERACAD